jgi:thiol-disulfide isomerase/thioredoxin
MSNKKRAAAPRSRISRPVNEPVARQGRGQSPILVLALVGVTVLVLGAIVVFAIKQSSNTTATPPTPVGTPGTPVPTPITGPLSNIGMMDSASGTAATAKATPAVGSKALDFAWKTTTGRTTLSAFKGKPVLLEFFGVWCPACQQEVPFLNKLLATYGPKGLQVLSVTGSPYGMAYESSGSTAPVTMYDMLLYQRRYGVNYQEVFDGHAQVFNMYGRGNDFPTFYVIDRKGIIRFGTSLGVTDNALTARIKAVM